MAELKYGSRSFALCMYTHQSPMAYGRQDNLMERSWSIRRGGSATYRYYGVETGGYQEARLSAYDGQLFRTCMQSPRRVDCSARYWLSTRCQTPELIFSREKCTPRSAEERGFLYPQRFSRWQNSGNALVAEIPLLFQAVTCSRVWCIPYTRVNYSKGHLVWLNGKHLKHVEV